VKGLEVRLLGSRIKPRASTKLANSQLKSPKPPAQTEEEKKAERLAKLEAWKKKQAEERERKQKELAATGGTRTLLDEIDKRAASSPAVASPHSPAGVNGDVSPPRYTGKFDPKAIARKATIPTTGATTLGKDVPLPEIAKASATSTSSAAGLIADKTSIAASRSSIGMNLFDSIPLPSL
jgi:ATP-dependent RNA helicase DDX46/PRP5